ncbi:MAG: L,D-transpeptidase [Rhodobiaceae bacterium]|nr:L,D-transpeptidase [Rhodobiaceae bacterium]
MKPITLLLAGAAVALSLQGAAANDYRSSSARPQPNQDMPFPKLMNSIFGEPAPARGMAPQAPAYQPYPQGLEPRRGAEPRSRAAYAPAQQQPTRYMPATPAQAGTTTPAFDPKYAKQTVAYQGAEKPGTIVIDTNERFLYLVEEDGKALRYGVGVGRPGFEWAGTHKVTRKAEWPDWRPPEEMRQRQPGLPEMMPGGPRNPLGARALYLGSTLYRIHGSNEPWTIGHAVSSGCIRMRNEDVMDLYERVPVGATVKVI